ncbi:MAG: barstar family protein [Eubacteriales bacterium]|nr:barstar family protein [Eubacteriales bacterium]
MQEVTIKVSEFDTVEEIHEYLAEELEFPAYYGKNLSALYDVLTDLSEDVRIIMDLSGTADEELLEEAEKMVEVMEDASEENEYLEIECEE